MTERCGDCKFWFSHKALYQPKCRRYPEYQHRNAHDWCGEYEAKQDTVKMTVEWSETDDQN